MCYITVLVSVSIMHVLVIQLIINVNIYNSVLKAIQIVGIKNT